MGTVYLAIHPKNQTTVAVKVLTADYQKEPAILERFLREAEAAKHVSHPCLVKVHECGHHEGTYYIVMEHVVGRQLSDILSKDGPLSPMKAVRLTRQLLEALSACHQAGIIHRDVKPTNLMIDSSDNLRVLDFGLVKMVDQAVLTRMGARVGSPRYMSPEMILTGRANERSDIYQVGLILYECLAGKPAFPDSRIHEVLPKIVSQPPPPLVELNVPCAGQVQGFLDRALDKDPAKRFVSCHEALRYLPSMTVVSGEAGVSGKIKKGRMTTSGKLPVSRRTSLTARPRLSISTLKPQPALSLLGRLRACFGPPVTFRRVLLAVVIVSLWVVALAGVLRLLVSL